MEYKDVAKHIKDSLKIVYTEFNSILGKYNKEYIYKKSIPYKLSKKCTQKYILSYFRYCISNDRMWYCRICFGR